MQSLASRSSRGKRVFIWSPTRLLPRTITTSDWIGRELDLLLCFKIFHTQDSYRGREDAGPLELTAAAADEEEEEEGLRRRGVVDRDLVSLGCSWQGLLLLCNEGFFSGFGRRR